MRCDQRPELQAELTPSLGQRIGARLADILWHRHYEIAELTVSVIWALWALTLLNPWVATFGSAPGYRVMAVLAPEWAWGTVALALAVFELAATISAHRWWRIGAAAALLAFGLFVGSLIVLSNPLGTGGAVYGGVALLSFFTLLRSAKEHPPEVVV